VRKEKRRRARNQPNHEVAKQGTLCTARTSPTAVKDAEQKKQKRTDPLSM